MGIVKGRIVRLPPLTILFTIREEEEEEAGLEDFTCHTKSKMGQIKMDATERGVLELKRHLLESEVQLNKPTLEQLTLYGVLTTDKAQEIRVSQFSSAFCKCCRKLV